MGNKYHPTPFFCIYVSNQAKHTDTSLWEIICDPRRMVERLLSKWWKSGKKQKQKQKSKKESGGRSVGMSIQCPQPTQIRGVYFFNSLFNIE